MLSFAIENQYSESLNFDYTLPIICLYLLKQSITHFNLLSMIITLLFSRIIIKIFLCYYRNCKRIPNAAQCEILAYL